MSVITPWEEDELENRVIKQDWEESKSGRGTIPYGCSLHKNLHDCQKYINTYFGEMPKEVPDEYERQFGDPYMAKVSDKIYKRITESELGIRIYSAEERELRIRKDIRL